MASSKVMASTSPPNPDLPRQSSIHSLTLLSDPSKNFSSMNMDELLKNIYAESEAFPTYNGGGGGRGDGVSPADGVALTSQGSFSLPKSVGNKSVDEVWKEIVGGNGENREAEMTLEDFLTKAGAVREEDVQMQPVIPISGYAVDSIISAEQFQVPPTHIQSSQNGLESYGVDSVGFGNGMIPIGTTTGGNVSRRKRRAEEPVDKATQQKQRRMIKNRESAARSRERKQAYTVELESLVTQLEEENARLIREEAELTKERFKQLMENLVPVVEKRKPPRALRRMNSM